MSPADVEQLSRQPAGLFGGEKDNPITGSFYASGGISSQLPIPLYAVSHGNSHIVILSRFRLEITQYLLKSRLIGIVIVPVRKVSALMLS